MTMPAPARRKGEPSRVGGARPSHLVTTTGVGALVDLPGMSVIVRGLDAWQLERAETIHEPRLLTQVQEVLGQQVTALREPPWDAREADDPWTRTGIPVSPFPGWLRCPACFRLGPMDEQQFELVHKHGRRPDLAKWVHTQCAKQNGSVARRRACIPARFLVACEAGHLDDFPYVDFVHRGAEKPCTGPRLTMRDASSSLGPRVTIRCVECGGSRNVSTATGKDGSRHLPRCRGRHPHLQSFEPCGKELRLAVLGASNLWFSVTASALHLPQGQTVKDQVRAHWGVLGLQPSAELVGVLVAGMPDLRALRDTPVAEVWAAIQTVKREGGPPEQEAGADLLQAEWRLLAKPTTESQDEDFRAVPTDVPDGWDGVLEQVVQVSRLREVQALIGFTRLTSSDRSDLEPTNRLPLGRGKTSWVPAYQQRGEGIFLQLREDRVRAWEARVAGHERIEALKAANGRWAINRGMPTPGPFPAARFLLLHTLSHMLLRQVALECGYSSSSIRERLYVGTPDEPGTGILLSTAASDSEGTLGGLVSLGHPDALGRLLHGAVEAAQRCSSDPLCAEHVPEAPSDTLHAAACHACLFGSETSCETNNRWLDRAVVVDLTRDGLAFLDL